MITLDLSDKNLIENVKALQVLRETGMFDDEQLQNLYDEQRRIDAEKGGKT